MRDFSKNKTPGLLRGISIHDLHLLHRQTPTENLIRQAKRKIREEPPEKLDVIQFPGDFFDRISQFMTEDVRKARAFITWLLRYCKEHDIKLRVLEGTASHDQKQSKYFEEQNEAANIGADVAYYDTLCMIDEAYGMKVLYLPDNYSHDPDVTLADVKACIAKNGLPDMIVGHGGFDHQLPPMAQRDACVHSAEAYNALVEAQKGWVVFGHIHIKSQNGRIVTAGSFGRLSHGEEEPKGMLRFQLSEDCLSDTWTFVENTMADIYKTVHLHGVPLDALADVLVKELKGLPENAHVLIKCKKDDAANHSYRTIAKTYNKFIWSQPSIDTEDNKKLLKNAFVMNVIEKGGDLTADNLSRLLVDRIVAKHQDVDQDKLRRWLEQQY